VAVPLPVPPAETEIHDPPLLVVQVQSLPPATVTLPGPPPAAIEALPGEIEKIPTVPCWFTANTLPATVSMLERAVQLLFCVTDQVTILLPAPLDGVQVSQVGELLEAVQLQPGSAVTVIVPLAAEELLLA
jgi:hypothetical protein